MRLVRDLGKRRIASVEDDLQAAIALLEGSEDTKGVPYSDGEGNYCAVGAAAAATFEPEKSPRDNILNAMPTILNAMPTYSFREDCLIQELYFALPREYRDANADSHRRSTVNGLRSLAQDHRRSVCIRYNDEHTKDEIVEWAKHALYRVRESERHRA